MQRTASGSDLDFQTLDQISIARFAGVETKPGPLIVTELGPLLEWIWLQRAGLALGALQIDGKWHQLITALESGIGVWLDAQQPSLGFIRVRRKHTGTEETTWIKFLRNFEDAGVRAGLRRVRAKQLAGATGELEDNVHWHSEAASTGLVAFHAQRNTFEFVVMDCGIGVLTSLKNAPEFEHLLDHGEALRLAVAPGTSRFGTQSGRGMGFNDLFIGIANTGARLRFRSGDYLFELDGRGLESPNAFVAPRAHGRGFMIAIQCAEAATPRR